VITLDNTNDNDMIRMLARACKHAVPDQYIYSCVRLAVYWPISGLELFVEHPLRVALRAYVYAQRKLSRGA
jgi:hypothetical protein